MTLDFFWVLYLLNVLLLTFFKSSIMKNYYYFIIIVTLFFQSISAQNCPSSIGSQSTIIVPHFKITPGTCNDYPTIITIDGSNFTKSSCNGANLKYTLVPPDPALSSQNTFTADFGFSLCAYVNGVLQTLFAQEFSIAESIAVYPNPLLHGSLVTIQFKSQISGNVEIYNFSGKMVFKDVILNSDKMSLNIPNMSNGIYLLRINSEDNSALRKIVIMR